MKKSTRSSTSDPNWTSVISACDETETLKVQRDLAGQTHKSACTKRGNQRANAMLVLHWNGLARKMMNWEFTCAESGLTSFGIPVFSSEQWISWNIHQPLERYKCRLAWMTQGSNCEKWMAYLFFYVSPYTLIATRWAKFAIKVKIKLAQSTHMKTSTF